MGSNDFCRGNECEPVLCPACKGAERGADGWPCDRCGGAGILSRYELEEGEPELDDDDAIDPPSGDYETPYGIVGI